MVGEPRSAKKPATDWGMAIFGCFGSFDHFWTLLPFFYFILKKDICFSFSETCKLHKSESERKKPQKEKAKLNHTLLPMHTEPTPYRKRSHVTSQSLDGEGQGSDRLASESSPVGTTEANCPGVQTAVLSNWTPPHSHRSSLPDRQAERGSRRGHGPPRGPRPPPWSRCRCRGSGTAPRRGPVCSSRGGLWSPLGVTGGFFPAELPVKQSGKRDKHTALQEG